ncbi:MAG: hypothetical protein WC682_01210 [Parcubacteria group bacterium]
MKIRIVMVATSMHIIKMGSLWYNLAVLKMSKRHSSTIIRDVSSRKQKSVALVKV